MLMRHIARKVILFLACNLLWITSFSFHAGAEESPGHRLLIYYGIPQGINQVWDDTEAANLFARYDVIVFGESLEEKSHSHHLSTQIIIKKIKELNQKAKIYGYVDLGVTTVNYSSSELKSRSKQWKEMGVDGIFLDDAGYDYKVSRKRLNETVQYIHNLGLSVFANAWKPEDIFASTVDPIFNPKGVATALGKNDIYLFEEFLEPSDITAKQAPSVFGKSFRKKVDKALAFRKELGIKLMAVSEIDYTVYSTNAVRKFFRMTEAAAGVFSLDAYGVAPLHFSASPRKSTNEVRFFPYIQNYFDFYDIDFTYVAKYQDQDFAREGFRIHSRANDHYFHFPAEVTYYE